jgi:4'-phosphopantetheinyl transferase
MFEKNTVHILYTKISHDLPGEIYKKFLNYLPASLQAEYYRYRRWQDRASNLFSKVLLMKGLEKFGYDYSCLEKLKYNEYGRPGLSAEVDFNISHSGEYTLCAVSADMKVGIDIEEIKQVDFSDFENLMTAEQWQTIKSADDPLRAFFKFWAIKESIIKADGRGLNIPLLEIQIKDRLAYYETNWYLTELSLDENYCASLAVNYPEPEMKIQYLEVDKM